MCATTYEKDVERVDIDIIAMLGGGMQFTLHAARSAERIQSRSSPRSCEVVPADASGQGAGDPRQLSTTKAYPASLIAAK